MKIIDYVVKTLLVVAGLLILGYFFPVVSWYVGTNRGSYYVNFSSPTKNLYGEKCPIDYNEGCINGVLVCKRIK